MRTDYSESFKNYLQKNFTKNSESYQDYEKAKKFLKTIELDYETGIKIIVEYLGI